MTGLYPVGTTCSNLTGAVYTSSNDAWGNVTSRTYNGNTATLSYDQLDQLVQWNAGTTSQEWYAYDLGGNRTLRRSTTGSGTTITVYAFGLQEHIYSSSGTPQSSTYYYTLGGRLIGELQGSTTQFFLSDALGSVITTFNATAGSAAVQGNQLYGPYGTSRYSKGSMGTNKGFTGQYADATGLDYYNARYYDPVIGRFLSADTVQGNGAGMDPYDYVGGNPETFVDPTGRMYAPPPPVGDPDPGCGLYCVGNQGGGVTKGSGCGLYCPGNGTHACDAGLGCHTKGVGQGTVYVKVEETKEVDATSYASVCYLVICYRVPTVHKYFVTTSHYVPIDVTFDVDVCISGLAHSCGEAGGDDSENTDDTLHPKPGILASDAGGDAVGGGDPVEAKIKQAGSGDKGARLEARTARLVQQYSQLVGFGNILKDANGAIITDIDVETPEYLIETTIGNGGKVDNILDRILDPQINPEGKGVVLYAPRYGPHAQMSLVEAMIESGVTDEQFDNFYFARTQQEFINILLSEN